MSLKPSEDMEQAYKPRTVVIASKSIESVTLQSRSIWVATPSRDGFYRIYMRIEK